MAYPPLHPDFAAAFGPTANGDSGAPVILEDGKALGIHVGQSSGAYGGNSFIVRLAAPLKRAERALRIRLRLATAPLD